MKANTYENNMENDGKAAEQSKNILKTKIIFITVWWSADINLFNALKGRWYFQFISFLNFKFYVKLSFSLSQTESSWRWLRKHRGWEGEQKVLMIFINDVDDDRLERKNQQNSICRHFIFTLISYVILWRCAHFMLWYMKSDD